MNITIETNKNDFLTDNDKIDIMNYIKEAYNNRKNIISKAKHKASTIGFDSHKIAMHLMSVYGHNKAIQAYIKSYIFKILDNKIESKKQLLIYKAYILALKNYTKVNGKKDLTPIKSLINSINEIENLKPIDQLVLKNRISLIYINGIFEGFEYENNPDFYFTKGV